MVAKKKIKGAKTKTASRKPVKKTKRVVSKPVKKKESAPKQKVAGKKETKRYSTAVAVIVFIVNFVIPGLGSLFVGNVNGIGQIVLFVIGVLLLGPQVILIGSSLVLIAWLWALWTSIQVIRRTN